LETISKETKPKHLLVVFFLKQIGTNFGIERTQPGQLKQYRKYNGCLKIQLADAKDKDGTKVNSLKDDIQPRSLAA
jgi:hypothetical protein